MRVLYTPKPMIANVGSFAPTGPAVQYGPAAIDQPRAEIAAVLNEQEKLTCGLLEQIDLLETRLMPVLAPAPPATAGAADPNSSVPVAACIAENSARIRRALSRIDDLRVRLAL